MTDILVLNTTAWAVLVGVLTIALPATWMGAFMLGRWVAWRWFERNGRELANETTAETNKKLGLELTEAELEIERLTREVKRRDERIDELVAVIRGAQLTSAKQTDILFTAINGRHDEPAKTTNTER